MLRVWAVPQRVTFTVAIVCACLDVHVCRGCRSCHCHTCRQCLSVTCRSCQAASRSFTSTTMRTRKVSTTTRGKPNFPRSCRSWPGCYISRCRQLRFRQLSCVASLALEAALGSLHAAAHRLRRGRRIRGHRRVRTGRQQRNCSAARCAAAADMPPAPTAEFGPSRHQDDSPAPLCSSHSL